MDGDRENKKLGITGRALLSVAAASKGITGIIRDDSHKSRGAFWAYTGVAAMIAPVCFGLMVVPGPNVLGIGFVLSSVFIFAGMVKALAALGISGWARRHDENHLSDIFDGAALIRRYSAYILPNERKPGRYKIKKRALFADTFREIGKGVQSIQPGPPEP